MRIFCLIHDGYPFVFSEVLLHGTSCSKFTRALTFESLFFCLCVHTGLLRRLTCEHAGLLEKIKNISLLRKKYKKTGFQLRLACEHAGALAFVAAWRQVYFISFHFIFQFTTLQGHTHLNPKYTSHGDRTLLFFYNPTMTHTLEP